MKPIYLLTHIDSGNKTGHGTLTGTMNWIEEHSGPVYTDIDFIDKRLKSCGKVVIAEGWYIETISYED